LAERYEESSKLSKVSGKFEAELLGGISISGRALRRSLYIPTKEPVKEKFRIIRRLRMHL